MKKAPFISRQIRQHHWNTFFQEYPSSYFIIGLMIGCLMVQDWLAPMSHWYKASMINPVDVPYIGFEKPVRQVPNWVQLTDSERKLTFSALPSSKIIDIPPYNPSDIRQGYDWSTASEAQRNAYITYSVPFMGNYMLDGTERSGSHVGVDIKIPVGTPIYAIGSGEVIKAKDSPTGYGQHIVIIHPSVPDPDRPGQTTTLYSSYSHLSMMEVRLGDKILKGDRIGLSGNTGMSTAPHLHFQLDRMGAPFYPYWPFSWSEVEGAGLSSYFEAVKTGFNQAKGYQNTISPFPYIAQNTINSTNLVVQAGVSTDTVVEPVTVANSENSIIETNSGESVEATAEVTKIEPSDANETVAVTNLVPTNSNQIEWLTGETYVPGVSQTATLNLGQVAIGGGEVEIRSTLRSLAPVIPSVVTQQDIQNGQVQVTVETESVRGFRLVAEGDFGSVKSNLLRAQVFSDIAADHPQAEAIAHLRDQGVIKGYADGTFQPQKTLNRAEALKIILEAKQVQADRRGPRAELSDVPSDAWFKRYVQTAISREIVRGYPDGTFKPAKTLNRAEFLKIAILAAGHRVGQPSNDPFTDVPSEAWFAPYFEFARAQGILRGNIVHPDGEISRGEAAEVIYKLGKVK